MNEKLNKILKTDDVDYVVIGDTDSIYLNLGPLVETVYANREKTDEGVVAFLDKVCQVELEKYIESSYQELSPLHERIRAEDGHEAREHR